MLVGALRDVHVLVPIDGVLGVVLGVVLGWLLGWLLACAGL